MAWKSVVTNAGTALLAEYTSGSHTLYIEGATVASGVIAEANMRIATALVNEQDTASIVSKTKVRNTDGIVAGMKFKVQIGPAATTAYTAHQIGLWARLDDGARTLLVLAQDSDVGVGIPLASESPEFAFAMFLTVAISNTDDLIVNIDRTTYVTMDTMLTALDEKLDKAKVANNLTTEDEGYALDARQGKLLKEAIDEKADASDVYSKNEINDALADKADVNNPSFTGVPRAPTAAAGTNTNQVATTAFVRRAIENHAISLSLTARADAWTDTEPPRVVLVAEGVTDDNAVTVGAGGNITQEQYEAIVKAQLFCTGQATDRLTITCFGRKPEIDLPVSVFIHGAAVETSVVVYEAGGASAEDDNNPVIDSGTSSPEDDSNPIIDGGDASDA